jgi:phage shock protein B
MEFFEALRVPLILFVIVVAPVWIIAHYTTRWRVAKSLTSEDERLLTELHDSAARMEARLQSLETILDAESPGWRTR